MAQQSSNYTLLVQKLDDFIRKYYMNKIIRGTLYFVGFTLALFLLLATAEYFSYFSTTIRKFLFYGFILSVGGMFSWLIGIPLIKYFKLGSLISHEQAANIIGEHFQNVKDKLLNILQLKSIQSSGNTTDLINASINQKVEELKPVPFQSAIDLSNNKKYAKYAIVPLLFLVIIMFVAPSMIFDSTDRIIKNDIAFEPVAPYKFIVNNEKLEVIQYNDFDLEIEVQGDALPDELFVTIGEYKYKLNQIDKTHFNYTFNNVQSNIDFKLESNIYQSKIDYELKVLKKPVITDFKISAIYPRYIGKQNEVITNIGDLTVPVGTFLEWSMNTQNCDEMIFKFQDSTVILDNSNNGQFTHKRRIKGSQPYSVHIIEGNNKLTDSLQFSVDVIPDLRPSISMEVFVDSSTQSLVYFAGNISDDYGLKSLYHHYSINREGQETIKKKTKISWNGSLLEASYDYSFDLEAIEIQPGDEVSYYFEVWDNDGFHGSKSAQSKVLNYRLPTVDEIKDELEASADKMEKELKESIKESQKIKEEIEALKNKLTQKKELSFEDKAQMEELMKKSQNLQENIEELQKEYNKDLQKEEKFLEKKEELKKKQEMVQKMFDELLDEEMKEMYEKIQKLMEEVNKDELMKQMDEMEADNEELENELDRMLEMFKQLEFEQKMEETIDELEKLAEEQEKLSEETKDKEEITEEDKKAQEELNEKFEDLEKEMEKLEEMEKELGDKFGMEEFEKETEDVKEEQQESSESLEQNDSKKASEKQKSASEKMKEMGEKMKGKMDSMQAEQASEDMEALRQLLENIVQLSFDEESLMEDFKVTNINDPSYVSNIQTQHQYKDDFELIADSLNALSQRVFQLETFITEKIFEIDKAMDASIDYFEARKKGLGETQQQYAMTSLNDLALMLDESLKQMQKDAAESKPGDQMCQNPGGNKGGKKGKKPSMSQLQKELSEQLSNLQDGKQKGDKPSSKQLSELAAKQSAIRKAMQQLREEEGGNMQGGEKGELDEMIRKMDENEKDIVNNQISKQTIQRQNEIITRLLESEKAERERDKEEKRESKTAQITERKRPPSMDEYLKKRQAAIERFKLTAPSFNSYYKNKIRTYLNDISK